MDFKFTVNESARLPIPCPKCSYKSNELLSRLRKNPDITCSICRTTFTVDGKQLDGFLKTLERKGR